MATYIGDVATDLAVKYMHDKAHPGDIFGWQFYRRLLSGLSVSRGGETYMLLNLLPFQVPS